MHKEIHRVLINSGALDWIEVLYEMMSGTTLSCNLSRVSAAMTTMFSSMSEPSSTAMRSYVQALAAWYFTPVR